MSFDTNFAKLTKVNYEDNIPTNQCCCLTPLTSSTPSKLPQTNEANNYVGITALVTSILSLGLAGIDLKRKYSFIK